MFQYRQVLARLRRGDSDREIARGKYMGRRQLAALRVVAAREGWLDPPGGHFKLLHLWPGQIPPPGAVGRVEL